MPGGNPRFEPLAQKMARNAAPEKSRSAKHRHNFPGHGKTCCCGLHMPLSACSDYWDSETGRAASMVADANMSMRHPAQEPVEVSSAEVDKGAVVTAFEIDIVTPFEAVIHHGSQPISGWNRRKGPHGTIGKNASGVGLASKANPLVQVLAKSLDAHMAGSRQDGEEEAVLALDENALGKAVRGYGTRLSRF